MDEKAKRTAIIDNINDLIYWNILFNPIFNSQNYFLFDYRKKNQNLRLCVSFRSFIHFSFIRIESFFPYQMHIIRNKLIYFFQIRVVFYSYQISLIVKKCLVVLNMLIRVFVLISFRLFVSNLSFVPYKFCVYSFQLPC